MDLASKQAHSRAQAREPSVVCPLCDVHTTPRDLLAHVVSRCGGRRDPHPGSTWLPWRAAKRLAPKQTLSDWVRRGLVRSRGELQDRQYLLRDLVLCVVWLRFQRSARARARR